MRKLTFLIVAGSFGCLSAFGAIDLKESKFTQVVNEVQIISTADNSKHPATVDGVFKMPDVLRTGPASRAELVAEDHTITRVGANTIFSFDAANRTIDLQQGSLLFNSPKGKGGGSIHTAAATAAVLGTTIIVTTTKNGGFKVLTLEGTAKVKFASGLSQQVKAGQLMFVLPGSLAGPILNFRLDQQTSGSKLVQGFDKPLASISKISAQISKQTKQIASGRAQDTGLLAGNSATSTSFQALPAISVVEQLNAIQNASQNAGAAVGGSGSGGTNPVAMQGNIPKAPPGTIVPSGNGYLTPDGYVFTSPPTNSGGGPGPAQIYASYVAQATLSDVTISSPTLDPNPDLPGSRVFTQGVEAMFPVADNFTGTADAGYFGRNITITTPSIDFTPYANSIFQNFVFFASENMSIVNSVTLSALLNTDVIFFAGNTLSISPGVSITGNSRNLEVAAANALNLSSVSIMNSGGGVSVESFASLNLNNCSLSAATGTGNSDVSVGNNGTFASVGTVSLNNTLINADYIDMYSAGTLTVGGSTPAAGQLTTSGGPMSFGGISLISGTGMTVGVNLMADPQNGSIYLYNGGSGLLTVNNGAQLTAGNIIINSADSVLIDSVGTVTTGIMNVTAGSAPSSVATIQNTTGLANVSSLAVNAYTVVLNNVNLGGQVSLNSFNGALAANPNTGAAMVPGDVNFIRNVNYNGSPAQGFINNGITIGKIP